MLVTNVLTIPLEKYRGQAKLITMLKDEVTASKIRHRALPNMVFAGPPGLGKTLLAHCLADARDVDIIKMMGPQMKEETLTVAASKMILPDGTVPGYDRQGFVVDPAKTRPHIWLIDEAEATPAGVFELLHDILQPRDDGRRIFHAKIPGKARRQPTWCPDLTVILITNYLGLLRKKADAAVNRCGIRWVFEPYENVDLITIIHGKATKEKVSVDNEAAAKIASRSLGIPRTAGLLLDRCIVRMLASIDSGHREHGKITAKIVDEALSMLGIDDLGLEPLARSYLKAIAQDPAGKMGLDAIAATIGSDKQTIAQDVEPFLMRLGLVKIVAGGRQICEKGLTHIGGENANPLHGLSLSNEYP